MDLEIGRNLIDSERGALCGKLYLIIDRDAKYTDQFRRLVRESGTEVIRLPPMSPNLNAYAERFVRSLKEECLNRLIFIGQASLRRAISEYMVHYHAERNHQGLENRLIRPEPGHPCNHGIIRRRSRLGGMLNTTISQQREALIEILDTTGKGSWRDNIFVELLASA